MTKQSEKRPYVPPRLTTYGSLRELTRTAGDSGKDGGANAVHSRT